MVGSIRALFAADARNVSRDQTLGFFLIYPPFLVLFLRFATPWIQESMAGVYNILPLYPLLASYFGILIMPTLAGVISGTLLLDERDTRTLSAMQVTPLPIAGYLAFKMAVPTLFVFVASILMTPLMGLVSVHWSALIVCAALGALAAPMIALILVNFAANKVQGLAVMKGASLLLSAPFIAWFVPQPWQWLFGVFPTFWPLKAFWVSQENGGIVWMIAAGIVVALVWLIPLLSHFRRNVFRIDW